MNETCGTCRHFNRFGNEPRGYCLLNPPTVLSQGQRRPELKDAEWCGHHDGSAPPTVKLKVNPETPGQAAKAARQEKEAKT